MWNRSLAYSSLVLFAGIGYGGGNENCELVLEQVPIIDVSFPYEVAKSDSISTLVRRLEPIIEQIEAQVDARIEVSMVSKEGPGCWRASLRYYKNGFPVYGLGSSLWVREGIVDMGSPNTFRFEVHDDLGSILPSQEETPSIVDRLVASGEFGDCRTLIYAFVPKVMESGCYEFAATLPCYREGYVEAEVTTRMPVFLLKRKTMTIWRWN